MIPIITVLNQKGGVGKTTLCHHLSGILAKMNLRVLLVDNDPQASLTQGFYGSDAALALDPAGTIAVVYGGEPRLARHLARPTGIDGIDLVAGHGSVANLNFACPAGASERQYGVLRGLIDGAGAEWDIVLIDCPPNLQLCSYAALVASTALVVPVQPEDYGVQGLHPVIDFRELVRSINPYLTGFGIVLNRVERVAVHKTYEERLRAHYGDDVFGAVLPKSVVFAESVSFQLPVSHHEPRSKASVAMQAVADELLARVEYSPSPILEADQVEGVAR